MFLALTSFLWTDWRPIAKILHNLTSTLTEIGVSFQIKIFVVIASPTCLMKSQTEIRDGVYAASGNRLARNKHSVITYINF